MTLALLQAFPLTTLISDGNATLPVSAPPRKLYPIDSETSLVLFFATHPFPKKSNESAPSTDATLKVIQKATTSLADRPETLPEDIETRFTERVDSPRGPLEASIDFPPSSSPCRTDLAITGLGFVADIVQREGTRQSLGFNVIKGDVICTFFADVKLTKSNAVPVDEEDGIPTAKW